MSTQQNVTDPAPRRPRPYVRRPDWVARRLANPLVSALHRLGLGVGGSRQLVVRGRKSGTDRRAPVNLLVVEGRYYLVAPRGHVQWTHNLRAAGEGRLRLGRRENAFTAVEVAEAARPELLRAYLKRWQPQVGAYFRGVTRDSTDAELRAVAADHPVFELTFSAGSRP
ncbi:nitroreductase family deazaflavin-dependent oxidoreductase [Streptomyces sp. DSM 44915]|uniref:Nitroreductase family deazaflavin-dependent oxidoreductase n=1 Tax=Streptomyces chisholmiae TaxID=3075540 RepID=A0ABU2JQP6_9ACTN|nr:nitroreductase family deazaflavin-dependent oxidoreductase [Streptomyces sp. DSM 44915]MDT0266839.1 nitroreductase family deazaflavin-dependent oxidoreductase [Streptomyces sp. DSM 44915]